MILTGLNSIIKYQYKPVKVLAWHSPKLFVHGLSLQSISRSNILAKFDRMTLLRRIMLAFEGIIAHSSISLIKLKVTSLIGQCRELLRPMLILTYESCLMIIRAKMSWISTFQSWAMKNLDSSFLNKVIAYGFAVAGGIKVLEQKFCLALSWPQNIVDIILGCNLAFFCS